MNESRGYSDVELKAGIFLFFCLALFVGMLLMYGRVSRFWRARQEIHVAFLSVGTLRPDAEVRYNGVAVGRVKSMRILHLDKANLERLAELHKKDLEFLPVSEPRQRRLRRVPDYDFDARCKAALRDQTMIELVLEVLQEGQYRRYTKDDTVRIATTVLGDTSIDIISGRGRPLDADDPMLLLGVSGDFFTNLSRSMDRVKEILTSVSEVVGSEERAAFKRSAGRLEGILAGMNTITQEAKQRMPRTARKLGQLDGASNRAMDSLGQLFERLQPDASRLFTRIEEARKGVGKRFEGMLGEVERSGTEFKAQTRAIRADVAFAKENSTPHFEEMKRNLRTLARRAGGVSGRIGHMNHVLGRALEQSQPDLNEALRSMKAGFENMKSLRYIREKTAELVSNRDRGEYDFYTLLDAYDRLRRISRWPRDAALELNAVRPYVPPPAPSARPGTALTRRELDGIRARVKRLEATLEAARDAAAAVWLPPFSGAESRAAEKPFPRKRAGRQPAWK